MGGGTNTHIFGITESDEMKVRAHLFNEIIAEIFPDLGKYMDTHVQKACRTSNKHNQVKISPWHITVKLSKVSHK